MEEDNTNTLLAELENFQISTKSPAKENIKVRNEPKTMDSDSDDFDEIMLRSTSHLGCDRREVPGSSPRPSVQSPYLSEDEDWHGGHPPGQRLGPIGQDNEDEAREMEAAAATNDSDLVAVVKQMEEDQEELTSNLMALTSHYAKVQLRLQQIVAAPNDDREALLKDLEEFAFCGIPNMKPPDKQSLCLEPNQELVVEDQKKKQAEAIEQLRCQLEELESYAYMSGDSAPPSKLVLDRQRLVMEQLRDRLNLNVEDIAALSEDQLRATVDSAVGQIVNPLKMKSQLVGQLQTQITDLEMFIQFLQEESSVKLPLDHGCGCEKHEQQEQFRKKLDDQKEKITVMKRALHTLQVASSFTTLGCGGGTEKFKRNTLKKGKGNHYGDLRAKLELSLEKLLDACCNTEAKNVQKSDDSEDDDKRVDTEFLVRSPIVTNIVRKDLTVSIRDLVHHGLGQGGGGMSFVPFSGCMSARRSNTTSSGILHAWDVVLKFYEMKGGAEFNSAPARRLSRSFGLDLAGSNSNNKQSLLQTIGQIIASHSQYKRSPDAHFKALICAGLNKRKLVPWLRLILRNQTVLETMYQPWSYAVVTGFDDTFKLLERLSVYVFNLPVDVAINQFQTMDEAF